MWYFRHTVNADLRLEAISDNHGLASHNNHLQLKALVVIKESKPAYINNNDTPQLQTIPPRLPSKKKKKKQADRHTS